LNYEKLFKKKKIRISIEFRIPIKETKYIKKFKIINE